MTKPIIHRIIAVFMAVYLPTVLVGVPLHKHYCQGELSDVKVFVETQSCHDSDEDMETCCSIEHTSCHTDQEEDQEALNSCDTDSCCDDQLELLKADVTLITKNSTELDIDLTEIMNNARALYLSHAAEHQLQSYDYHTEPSGPFLNGLERLVRFEQFLC